MFNSIKLSLNIIKLPCNLRISNDIKPLKEGIRCLYKFLLCILNIFKAKRYIINLSQNSSFSFISLLIESYSSNEITNQEENRKQSTSDSDHPSVTSLKHRKEDSASNPKHNCKNYIKSTCSFTILLSCRQIISSIIL